MTRAAFARESIGCLFHAPGRFDKYCGAWNKRYAPISHYGVKMINQMLPQTHKKGGFPNIKAVKTDFFG
jgi:hypothetical protein